MNAYLNALIPRQRGFTLIESIIVIVVMAIAALAIISLNANIFTGRADNRNLLVGTALMQGCVEKILATRRVPLNANVGYDDPLLAPTTANTTLCGDGQMAVTGYVAPTVTITNGNASTLGTACPYTSTSDPDANDCKLVSITQNNMTPILLLLVRG